MLNLPEQFYTLLAVFIVFVILLLVVPQLVAGTAGSGSATRFRRTKKAFLDVAERTNLDYIGQDALGSFLPIMQENDPGLKGLWRGRRIAMTCQAEIFRNRLHQVESFQSHTEIGVKLAHDLWQEGVKIEPRSRTMKWEKKIVGNLTRVEDVEDVLTGDRQFDEDFLISGLVGDAMKAALKQPALQDTLTEMAQRLDWFQIKLGQLITELPETPDNADDLLHALERTIDAADVLDEAIARGRDQASEQQSEMVELFPQL